MFSFSCGFKGGSWIIEVYHQWWEMEREEIKRVEINVHKM